MLDELLVVLVLRVVVVLLLTVLVCVLIRHVLVILGVRRVLDEELVALDVVVLDDVVGLVVLVPFALLEGVLHNVKSRLGVARRQLLVHRLFLLFLGNFFAVDTLDIVDILVG